MNQMTPQYRTMLFCEVFDDQEDFEVRVGAFGGIQSVNLGLLYLLLSARYGNSPIANSDIHQFVLKVWSIVFQYGPSWAKRLEIQSKLRALTDEEIIKGTKTIYNHSFNPSTEPSTSSLEELETINDQTTNNLVRGKLEGYGTLLSLIESDVTEEFLSKFKPLFKQFVMPEDPLLYISEGEE